MQTEKVEEFKTFYFKTGFESLVPLMSFIESQYNVECGLGSSFINVYTENPAILKRIGRSIRRWPHKHVQLDEKEHGNE